MRREAAAARSSGVWHAARSTPLNGSSLSFWRTAFWSASDSSSIFGDVAIWRITSPTKRFWRMGTRLESVRWMSQARSDLLSWLRDPSTVSKAWVPSEPYSFSRASLKAFIVALFAVFPWEKMKLPRRAVAFFPCPCTTMSRLEKCVALAAALNESSDMDICC